MRICWSGCEVRHDCCALKLRGVVILLRAEGMQKIQIGAKD